MQHFHGEPISRIKENRGSEKRRDHQGPHSSFYLLKARTNQENRERAKSHHHPCFVRAGCRPQLSRGGTVSS